MKPWFLRYPERLQYELDALAEAGYTFTIDEYARTAGHIVIAVQYPLAEEKHQLTAHFPENYPYFPFEIHSLTFPSGRHKNPTSGALCLLKNPHSNWKVTDTLASMLDTQVPAIVKAHADPDGAADIEAHEAAQLTGFVQYAPGTTVFTGEWSLPPDIKRGFLVLGIEESSDPDVAFRGAVLTVQDESKNVLAAIDERIASRYRRKILGRWVRLLNLPASQADLHEAAIAAWPALRTPKFSGGPDLIGLLMPEELEYNKVFDNWIFLVRQKSKSSRQHPPRLSWSLARADRASPEASGARVPKLRPLGQKKVFIAGLGSIGSIIAWQLARAGIGGIHLMDFDHLQLGNSARWLLGISASGYDKGSVLRNHLKQEYPFVDVRAWIHRVGTPAYPGQPGDLEILPECIEGVDLIVDATAEWCVSHYLSDLARDRGIPFLWATGTPGAYGGIVGRVVPGRTAGCWKCFQHHLNDNAILIPNQETTPDIQPPGCFHSTFTGTGFDMDHVSLAVVRLIVSTLCSSTEGGYPDFDWDIGVVNTWSDKGQPIAPQWITQPLVRHQDCSAHD